MTRFAEHSIATADGLRLYVRDYDSAVPGRLPVVCLPGLTRNHRDFAALATRLAPLRRVICPDMRGRGLSDRDPDPARYAVPVEAGDVLAMLDALGVTQAAFVGTSRGGLQVMALAVMRPAAIAAAVLNDVGPRLERAGLERIVAGMSDRPTVFTGWEAAAQAVRQANESQLPGLDDAAWLALARCVMAERDGRIVPDHDPALALGTRAALAGELPELWPAFEALAGVPLLAIRGGLSDILSAATLDEMQARIPAMRRLTLPGRGHVPFLDEPEAVAAIEALLDEADPR